MTRQSVPIVLLVLLAAVVVSLIADGQGPVAAETAGCSWNQIPTTPSPTPSSTVLDQTNFVDRDIDGVPDQWGSSTDYTRKGCRRVTGHSGEDSLVKQVIHPNATNPNASSDESADVSIQRVYQAASGQIFTASAEVDI